MRFVPHPELPGFATHTFDTCHKEHYYHPNHTGLSSREAELQLQFRTVPGQTIDSVRADLVRLLDGIGADHPGFAYALDLPAPGTERTWCQDPMLCPAEHPLVEALADGQSRASGNRRRSAVTAASATPKSRACCPLVALAIDDPRKMVGALGLEPRTR